MAKGQFIGYIRVSTLDQNPDRQLEGHPVDKIFTDKASGKDQHRPRLKEFELFGGDTLSFTHGSPARNLMISEAWCFH
jgi:hypothetical protein